MPYPLVYEPLVRAALLEDLGRAGDLTTDTVVPADATARARFVARHPGRVAGLTVSLSAFRLLDPGLTIETLISDGSDVAPGDTLAVVSGLARPILSAERTALNLLGRLCGIATATRGIVQAVEGCKARITCTRKTTPGLRALEKEAVRFGGGSNHRFGLDDAVLIKDNHLIAGGGIQAAVARARAGLGHMVKIEVEVDTLAQLEELIPLGVDAVLLDNMPPETLARAVSMVDSRMLTEASGNISARTVRAVAETGVDMISVGWLTHSVTNFDVGLDFD
ncbi:nicotinate-nucleotide pyrophosphorylase (carboxylating) [Skermanella aerolata]|uniref:Probable nicotinate-nucleotide pyrophosphorylase [carboxylating] n=1 Tax=Skermanella aerolata TaxID=393310 RepID=A0A512DJD3_9PROT|nr:carboxylating nicotinate-nucleotide diphosphorylase [Skermanella aerolata]KJB97486.1 nicotinate-nucleotide pyrophosphorylase [Skermanella aerolata KACC 11604]GEO36300.1 nicotinate-nucleotide pyrophosphorylase [carboxylating] [Skermanella aerolata]